MAICQISHLIFWKDCSKLIWLDVKIEEWLGSFIPSSRIVTSRAKWRRSLAVLVSPVLLSKTNKHNRFLMKKIKITLSIIIPIWVIRKGESSWEKWVVNKKSSLKLTIWSIEPRILSIRTISSSTRVRLRSSTSFMEYKCRITNTLSLRY